MRKSLFILTVLCIGISCLYSCQDASKDPVELNLEKELDTIVKTEIEILDLAISSDSLNGMKYLNRANYYVENRDLLSAHKDYIEAYMLDSNNVDIMLAVADFLPRTGYAEEAFRIYNKILNTRGKNKQAFLGLSKIQAYLTNYKEALNLADSALVMDLHNRDAYMLKAMIFRNMGSFKETVSSYQTAIEQDPNYIPAYVALGNVYANKKDASQQDYVMSENYYNSALELDSNHLEANYGMGMLLQNTGKYDRALYMYDRIIKNDEKFSTALFNQGFVYLNLKVNLDSAAYFFEETIKVDSLYFQAYHNLGEAYKRKGDLEKAKSHYLNALRIQPEFELSKIAVQNIYK
jgi:tetratricopeptide (TPR) repeat protein